jgi:hypothetical protein
MQGLNAFIVAAKAACYVGKGAQARASRKGAHDLTFGDGPFEYRDSYFGGTDFLGQETVWHRTNPIWAMNYYGRILRDDLIDADQGALVIRTALSAMYAEDRFLDGFHQTVGSFDYHDENTGDVHSFFGVERIVLNGVKVYQLDYHGGMIRP